MTVQRFSAVNYTVRPPAHILEIRHSVAPRLIAVRRYPLPARTRA